ncbi:MAG: hypothetical protein WC455_19170, partial [Dehalococcoidia bacterium]
PGATATPTLTVTSTPATMPPTATRTPTVTRTATSVVVATQTPTRTPTRTPTDDAGEASPTAEVQTETITPEPGGEKVCLVRNLSNGPYNIRAAHVANSTIVGQVPDREYATVLSVYVIQDVTNEWFRVTYGTVTGWMIRDDTSLVLGANDTLDICLDTSLTPTEYASNPPPSPAPTPVGPTPTAIPPIPVGCTVKNGTTGNLNTRSGPGLNYAVIGTLRPGETGQAIQTYSNGEEVWINFSRLSSGGQNVFSWVARFIPAQGNLASLVGDCSGLPVVVGSTTPFGIHVLGGFQNSGEILRWIEHFGVLKITDDSWYLATEARKINPDIFIVQRNIHLVDVGRRDCPWDWATGDPVMSARNWYSLQYRTWQARGLIGQNSPISRFEYRNECSHAHSWEVAFDREIIRLANADHLCLAVFSHGYGNPEIEEFVELSPVLDDILKTECRPGERHVVALHTYGRPDSGLWIFFRWTLFRDALHAINPKYDAIQYVFSEQGVTNSAGQIDGRGSADCPRAAIETRQAVDAYKPHSEVIGFALFSVGGSTEWLDLTGCLGQIAAALQ